MWSVIAIIIIVIALSDMNSKRKTLKRYGINPRDYYRARSPLRYLSTSPAAPKRSKAAVRAEINNEDVILPDLADIDRLSENDFKGWCIRLLRIRGYELVSSQGPRKNDIIIKKNEERTLVQCFYSQRHIYVEDVEELYRAQLSMRCDHSAIMTNFYYTEDAKTVAGEYGMELIDRTALESLADSANIKIKAANEQKRKAELLRESKKRTAGAMIYSIDGMSAEEFKRWCIKLLADCGFELLQYPENGREAGVDIVATKDNNRYAFRCERCVGLIGPEMVKSVRTGYEYWNCHYGGILTSSYFSENAKKTAEMIGILLWDRDKLADLILNKIDKQKSKQTKSKTAGIYTSGAKTKSQPQPKMKSTSRPQTLHMPAAPARSDRDGWDDLLDTISILEDDDW